MASSWLQQTTAFQSVALSRYCTKQQQNNRIELSIRQSCRSYCVNPPDLACSSTNSSKFPFPPYVVVVVAPLNILLHGGVKVFFFRPWRCTWEWSILQWQIQSYRCCSFEWNVIRTQLQTCLSKTMILQSLFDQAWVACIGIAQRTPFCSCTQQQQHARKHCWEIWKRSETFPPHRTLKQITAKQNRHK